METATATAYTLASRLMAHNQASYETFAAYRSRSTRKMNSVENPKKPRPVAASGSLPLFLLPLFALLLDDGVLGHGQHRFECITEAAKRLRFDHLARFGLHGFDYTSAILPARAFINRLTWVKTASASSALYSSRVCIT